MLQRFLPLAVKIRKRHPGVFYFLARIAKRFFGQTLGVFPRILGNEVEAVTEILRSSQWNMAYGRGLVHERLEAEFSEFVGTKHAVAVGSGGMALQMSLRALGLKPGDEAIHQVDTCSATAMAVMNAGVTPIFADISEQTFMLDCADVQRRIGGQTKALIATHMWGNPEDVSKLRQIAHDNGLRFVEDTCLALGAIAAGKPAGCWGDVGVFSFGCLKPIQTGEGGMIVTNDEALAKELRSLRHWGDRTIEFGVRDVTQLAWNGRMSEILAGIAREQLRGYPGHLEELRARVADFRSAYADCPGFSMVLGATDSVPSSAFTQVVLRLEESAFGLSKRELMDFLGQSGVPHWHANFELINTLSFFRGDAWRDWILRGDIDRVAANNSGSFPAAERVYAQSGLGLSKSNFLSDGNRRHLDTVIQSLSRKSGS
ncbi:DegT/DnrJ/EryC1/StrS family aminotransferase [Bradyrhizobium sp. GCM10023182]|uniref:DegT/DnrJ/EryC1/StrS family aminotransferase n=1 Tax=Bradyrhizobium zhengyangense TaxID=2911009 RepID=A0ABS9LY48_9BRAD|nr:DegT/DnrJ/EryC1/StrS family aminotransferase [Bradyrhizobium zhengyangense]MCG2671592.1 DegT/DnrJ/EryC1/StrS family aminotransferase [Bradyrhizobium zhengyangense]